MGNTVYYCGCLHDVGHFVYTQGVFGKEMGSPEGCPWPYLDSDGFRKGVPQRQGNAGLRHKDGWTVLSIHDFTVDDRGGSHSTFAVDADLGFKDMCKAIEEQWPEILLRVGPITLIEES